MDRTGRILRLVPEAQGGKLVTLPDRAVPQPVAAAFVAAEDQRFWRHPGIDPLAVLRAAMSNLSHGRIVSGASTITMQLARLTYPGPRSYYRKLVEFCRSLRIELALSKDEILRLYLDRVPLGNNLMGVEAGAQAYFGKTAARLTVSEAALLAALVKAPGALNPYGPAPRPPPGAPALGSRPHGAAGLSQPPGTPGPAVGPRQASGATAPAPRPSPLRPRILSTWSWPRKNRRPRVPSGSSPPWI